ncbi:hypothetical protein FBEOM_7642 [Fusarium beomiforme]|uniref:Uncharacterized protein n=1 Tax=Fusarium beomiforme TaxID=44412 RepID=A0A9P5AGU3_9HYPO|nr:hypothetical protein FBEOM_7642 [Fusarium beomiforme]
MGIRDFFGSRFFEHGWRNKLFILQVVTITIAFILGIAKVATRPSNIPMTRSDVMAITMSLKSYAFLAYEHIRQKVNRFKRFGSMKADVILNTLDIIFWIVVMGLAFNIATQVYAGANCAIGVLVGLVALVVASVNFWAAVIAWKDHNGGRHGLGSENKSTFLPSRNEA